MKTIHTLGAAFSLSLAALATPLAAQQGQQEPQAPAQASAPAGQAAAAPAATITGAAAAQQPRREARRSRDELVQDEIRSVPQSNMYEVVRSLRPRWLRERGDQSLQGSNGIKVYLDGILVGETGELRTLDPRTVTSGQFLSPQDATTRFGSDHTRGAILLSTRTQN